MKPESAYYESLHETPLIANTIARKKLYEMNKVRACVRARVRPCVRSC
jgi:ketol-acid reductoisomerase